MGRQSSISESALRLAIDESGSLRGAARLLGIPEANARYYANKYGIDDRSNDDDFYMSQRDVAEALGITVHAVKVAERNAIAKMRRSGLARFIYG